MKRIGIFFFYDEKGIVDEYVIYFLTEISKYLEKIVIVCNGFLTPTSRKKLKIISNHIIVRDNFGFDVWAYKEAIDYVGWDEIYKYEELILFNFTNFGPIFSFKEMFTNMENRKLDFWGITKFHGRKNKGYLDKYISYDYLPEHIQSHFIAIRGKMLKSYELKYYWDNMKPVNSYAEAVGYHEAIFTQKFSDYGYTWDVYADSNYLKPSCEYPLMWQPLDFIKKTRCPIVKRRSFFYIPYYGYLHNGTGEASVELYNYIKNNTNYNTELIWDNILRTSNMVDIKRSLQLNYVIPSAVNYNNNIFVDNTVVLILITENNCLEKYIFYLKNILSEDLYFYVIYENKKVFDDVNQIFNRENIFINEYCIISKEYNLYYEFAKILVSLCEKFEYLCCINFHIEKSHNIRGIEESVIYSNCENLIKSKEFIINIRQKFEENNRLGMLVPTTPLQADYSKYLSREWADSLDVVQRISEELEVPFDRKKPINSPYKGMFWVRCKSLNKLSEYLEKSTEKDLLFKENGSIYSGLNACLALFVQKERYFTATVLSDNFAAIELTNMRFYLEEIKLNSTPYSDTKNFIDLKNVIINNKSIFK